MRYLSTRDSSPERLSFSDILLAGLAPDGGLYVPVDYPTVSATDRAELRQLYAEQGYAALAARVIGLFAEDIDPHELLRLSQQAYSSENFTADPGTGRVPLLASTSLPGAFAGIDLVHLSQGPTAAFKDMAMQLLARLFERELELRDDTLTVLGATSGDTGSAAEHAMVGMERLRVVMLTPQGRMTPFQRAQMFTVDDPAITNVAVEGTFDACQDLVKAVNSDAAFKARHRIGAANSINWARVVAQVAYHIAGWLGSSSHEHEVVDVTVPTGNFGNLLGGHIARQMGFPIGQLVLATNENDVLTEFVRTGVYTPRSPHDTPVTSSPSMDISRASNLERLLFDAVGRDPAALRELMAELSATGSIDLRGTPIFSRIIQQFGLQAGRSTHADRLATIRAVREAGGPVIDPHTADGVHVAADHQRPGIPMLVLETALPVKFAETITEALGEAPPLPERFAELESLEQHVVNLPDEVTALRELIEQAAPPAIRR